MRLSFIVTTYNVAPYLRRCIDSVLQVAQPGDEIIILDDGSTDETRRILKSFPGSLPPGHPARGKMAWDTPPDPQQIHWRTVLFGVNTHGGVGIAANVGLDMATKDGVFFVDGDDWLDVEGVRAARARFESSDDEIMLVNYQEFDEATQSYRPPADHGRWADIGGIDLSAPQLEGHAAPRPRRLQALSMIAVPWRKFYRRDLFERHRIRFPEGDFFFEDNPLHWDVCLKARRIGFYNRVCCYHRVRRPGQTMTATDARLTAFFTHFDTILAKLPEPAPGDPRAEDFHVAAMEWLVSNMTWHLMRIHPGSYWAYASRAARALSRFDGRLWHDRLAPRFAGTRIGTAVEQLMTASVAEVVMLWHIETQLKTDGQPRDVATEAGALLDRLEAIEKRTETLAAWAEWRSLKDTGREGV